MTLRHPIHALYRMSKHWHRGFFKKVLHSLYKMTIDLILHHFASHCNTLQHNVTLCITLHRTTTHCNALLHIATHCNTVQEGTGCNISGGRNVLQCVAVCCSVLQCAAVLLQCISGGRWWSWRCVLRTETLQHTVTHCNTLEFTVTKWRLQLTATHCNTLQLGRLQHFWRKAAIGTLYTQKKTLQHTATHCT